MGKTRLTVGECEILGFNDATLIVPWHMLFPEVPVADLEGHRDLYPGYFHPGGYPADAGCYVIRSGGKSVLVDTGIGPGPIVKYGGVRGHLVDDMRAADVTPESIDIVVHTHLHIDHVGWNLAADGTPTFPNATYYAPAGDLDHFGGDADANPHVRQVLGVQSLGCLETYHGELALTPHVTTIPTPGHTPDHHSILVASGGEAAIIMGDVLHHPAQLSDLEWRDGYDVDHARAIQTRKRMVDELEATGRIAAFAHFSGERFGRIIRRDGRRVFQTLR